jgi:DNA mismatch repair ATPase MutS
VNSENNEKLIERFVADPDFRLNCQLELAKLKDKEAGYIPSLFQEEHVKPPRWIWVVRFLSFASLLSLFLAILYPGIILALFVIVPVNFVVHYWNKRNLSQYVGSLPQLLKLKSVAEELYKIESFKSLDANLPRAISELNKIRNRMLFFKLEAQLQGDMEAVAWGILELVKIFFVIEPILLFDVLRRLETKREEIESVYSFVGRIDVLISVASLRSGPVGFCIPEVTQKPKYMKAVEVFHPLIVDCVKNNIEICGKSVLLTGSNMSGKTSFIRTIGLNVLTGLTLNTCFARQFVMPRVAIFSAVRMSDDLMNDKSYYFEEVLTIKEMIDHAVSENSNLFLLDEIFKGTNTVERISAGKAVLSALSKGNNLVFVSTHDIELAEFLKEEFDLYHFSEQVNQKSVDFDYKLKNGKLKNRNAIRILQINNYPDEVIDEALSISKELDRTTLKLN